MHKNSHCLFVSGLLRPSSHAHRFFFTLMINSTYVTKRYKAPCLIILIIAAFAECGKTESPSTQNLIKVRTDYIRHLRSLRQIPMKLHFFWHDPARLLRSSTKLVEHGVREAMRSNPAATVEFYNDSRIDVELSRRLPSMEWQLLQHDHVVAKTDILRLLLMYQEGGFYMDVDTLYNRPLTTLFNERTRLLLPTFFDCCFSHQLMCSSAGNVLFQNALMASLKSRRSLGSLKKSSKHILDIGPSMYQSVIAATVFEGLARPEGFHYRGWWFSSEEAVSVRHALNRTNGIIVTRKETKCHTMVYDDLHYDGRCSSLIDKRSLLKEQGRRQWSDEVSEVAPPRMSPVRSRVASRLKSFSKAGSGSSRAGVSGNLQSMPEQFMTTRPKTNRQRKHPASPLEAGGKLAEVPSTLLMIDTRGAPPARILQRWSAFHPTLKHHLFWNSAAAEDWLTANYDEHHVRFFKDIEKARYKADFFKLSYLFRVGGWFSDADMEPTAAISSVSLQGITFFTAIIMDTGGRPNGNAQNTIIATVPGHPIMKAAIAKMREWGTRVGIDPPDAAPFTGLPTKCLYEVIQLHICAQPQPGLWATADGPLLLGTEELREEDRISRGHYYGWAIWLNNTRLAYTRDQAYTRAGFGPTKANEELGAPIQGRQLSKGRMDLMNSAGFAAREVLSYMSPIQKSAELKTRRLTYRCEHSCHYACLDVEATKPTCSNVRCGGKCAKTCCAHFHNSLRSATCMNRSWNRTTMVGAPRVLIDKRSLLKE